MNLLEIGRNSRQKKVPVESNVKNQPWPNLKKSLSQIERHKLFDIDKRNKVRNLFIHTGGSRHFEKPKACITSAFPSIDLE